MRKASKNRHLPFRIHINEENAINEYANHLIDLLPANKDLVIVCIGTDRSTGDSLGPLIGSRLRENHIQSFYVYGCLEDPIHAVNLEARMNDIFDKHDDPFIIGIDACLGRTSSVGYISINDGPVKPGAAVNKKLPPVGNIHLTGIVNVGGFMEYMVLQNTRLHLVIKMADTIAKSILMVDKSITHERKRSFLEKPLKQQLDINDAAF